MGHLCDAAQTVLEKCAPGPYREAFQPGDPTMLSGLVKDVMLGEGKERKCMTQCLSNRPHGCLN